MAAAAPTALSVTNTCPDEVSNLAYVHPDDFDALKREFSRVRAPASLITGAVHLECAKCTFMLQSSQAVPKGRLGLSTIARIANSYAVGDSVPVKFYNPNGSGHLVRSARIEVDFLQKKAQVPERFNATELADCLRSACERHTLTVGQRVPLLIFHRYRIVYSVVAITVGTADSPSYAHHSPLAVATLRSPRLQ